MEHLIPQGQGALFLSAHCCLEGRSLQEVPPGPARAAGRRDVQGICSAAWAMQASGKTASLHSRESVTRKGRGRAWYKGMVSNPMSEEALGGDNTVAS